MDKYDCIECKKTFKKNEIFDCVACGKIVCIDCWYSYYPKVRKRRKNDKLLKSVELCKKCST